MNTPSRGHKMNLATLQDRQAEIQRLGGLPSPDRERLLIAYLTEVAELAQELKRDWAWWSKPSDSVPSAPRVLEEAADVLHFWLLDTLHRGQTLEGDLANARPNTRRTAPELLADLFAGPRWYTPRILCELVGRAGFTPDDLAAAYWAKTEENLRRWGVK